LWDNCEPLKPKKLSRFEVKDIRFGRVMASDGEDSICHNDLTASHRIVLEMLVGRRHSSPVSYSSFCIDFDSGDAAQIKAVAYSFGVVIGCSSIESSVEMEITS
jgi:hypothetical protein